MNEWVNGTWKQKSIRPEIDGGNLDTNWIGTNVVNIIITIFNVWVCVCVDFQVSKLNSFGF